MKSLKKINSQGFTLIELMLALSIFSLVMLIATTGFIGINRTFTRGLIRKQLSQTVQFVSDDTTRIVRTNIQTAATLCSGSDCPNGWSALCFGGTVRYIWQDSGGMFRDNNTCSAVPDSTKKQIVDSRFKIQTLSVTPSSDYLFNIHGVISTTDPDAFTQKPVTNPDTLQCLGTAQSSSVRTCAIQKFDFLVNSRGGGYPST